MLFEGSIAPNDDEEEDLFMALRASLADRSNPLGACLEQTQLQARVRWHYWKRGKTCADANDGAGRLSVYLVAMDIVREAAGHTGTTIMALALVGAGLQAQRHMDAQAGGTSYWQPTTATSIDTLARRTTMVLLSRESVRLVRNAAYAFFLSI